MFDWPEPIHTSPNKMSSSGFEVFGAPDDVRMKPELVVLDARYGTDVVTAARQQHDNLWPMLGFGHGQYDANGRGTTYKKPLERRDEVVLIAVGFTLRSSQRAVWSVFI